MPALIELIASQSEWKQQVAAHVSTIAAEVIHAVRHEMACTLADAVLRRTALSSSEYPGDAAAGACATLMASELGWDAGRIDREVDDRPDLVRVGEGAVVPLASGAHAAIVPSARPAAVAPPSGQQRRAPARDGGGG